MNENIVLDKILIDADTEAEKIIVDANKEYTPKLNILFPNQNSSPENKK